MLKERITYKEELPINVAVVKMEEYPIHFHDDIEVVYMLKGSVKLKNGYYTEQLKSGDIFILNGKEIHSFESIEDDNMVMMLHINGNYFSNYYGNLKNSFFVTDMSDENEESLEILRGILARIMMEILQKGYGYEDKVIESTHNLISCLMSDFQYFAMEDGRFVNEGKNKGNKVLAGRLSRITEYMYENYTRKLTLGEIAEREHLSVYYLSHVIKEATGLSFQDLLSFIRVEESERLLLGTGKKVGTISGEVGFSAIRYYIKHFETWFGMHPNKYRKLYTGKVQSREIPAKYKRSLPGEIEVAIKKQVQGIYGDYFRERSLKPLIVELDLVDAFMDYHAKEPAIPYIKDEDVAKALFRPYNIFMSLKERILYATEGCIISTGAKHLSELGSITILIYDFNPESFMATSDTYSREAFLDIIKEYGDERETLVRCGGMSGDFRLARYRMSRENVISAYEEILRPQMTTNKRQAICNSWSTLPNVEFNEVSISDTLNLRTTLKGFSAELILVDKK